MLRSTLSKSCMSEARKTKRLIGRPNAFPILSMTCRLGSRLPCSMSAQYDPDNPARSAASRCVRPRLERTCRMVVPNLLVMVLKCVLPFSRLVNIPSCRPCHHRTRPRRPTASAMISRSRGLSAGPRPPFARSQTNIAITMRMDSAASSRPSRRRSSRTLESVATTSMFNLESIKSSFSWIWANARGQCAADQEKVDGL